MALKTKEITIEKGRDAGVRFIITEMPVVKADKWAMKALLILASSGAEVAKPEEGMLGLAKTVFSSLQRLPTEEVLPLLDELLDCVQIIPEGGTPRKLDLALNDVQDFSTLWYLRKEVIGLHIDFLQDVLTRISA